MHLARGPRFGKAHTGPVHVARLASKGKYVLTGGADGRVCLWNASSSPPATLSKEGLHIPIEAYNASAREVLSIDVAQDNATFASAGHDRNVVLWDVVTASPIRRLPGSVSGRTHSVCFTGQSTATSGPFRPDGSVLAAGGFDRMVRMYDLRSSGAKPLMELPEATDAILTLATTEDVIVSGSVDGVVRTYDVRSGNMTSDDLGDPITSIALDAEGRMLVTALKAPPRILDTSEGKLLGRLNGAPHEHYRCHAGLLPDGTAALGGGEDGHVYLWDTRSSTPRYNTQSTLPPLQSAVSTVPHDVSTSAPSRQAQVLWSELVACSNGSYEGVSASTDGSVQVWTVQ